MGADELQGIEQRIAALEERLRTLEDERAIVQMKARYAELVDARYGKDGPRPAREIEPLARQLSLLFCEDAVWDGGPGLGVCIGREAIRERFLAPTLSFSWHYFVKPRIEVTGDTARGTWDILSPCTTAEGRPMWMAGVERDEYVRERDAWLHARMELEVVFMAPHDRGWGPRPRRD